MYKYNYEFFKNIDSEAKAYILAWFWMRGSGHIQIAERDIEILHLISRELSFTGPIHIYNGVADIHIYNAPLLQAGCVLNKKHLSTLPNLPDNLLAHFVRGLVDSYGRIIVHKNKYLNIYLTLCESIVQPLRQYLHNQLNIDTKHYYRYEHTNTLQMMITTTIDAEKFLKWLYKDGNFYLERKFVKYQEWSKKGV